MYINVFQIYYVYLKTIIKNLNGNINIIILFQIILLTSVP